MSNFRRNIISKLATSQTIVTERYITGYANGGNTIGFSIDGGDTYLTATASTEDGSWRIDIPSDTVISTLAYACSQDNYNGNYALTYVDISHIGSLASCTSMTEMFKNCSALTGVNFGSPNTKKVTDMTAMFNGCSAIKSLDLSKLSTAGIPLTTDVTGMSNFLYTSDECAITSISLPEMRVYVSSNFFYNTSNLTTINSCGEIHQRFKIYKAPLTRASALVLINALSSTAPSKANLNLSTTTYALLTDADKQIAIDKGWTVVNGNS